MVWASDVLVKGALMVRVTGRYQIVEGTRDSFDAVFDELLGALLLDKTIQDPDATNLSAHDDLLKAFPSSRELALVGGV
jgi:hypothetical protein